MISPPPFVKLVALFLFTALQFRFFRPQMTIVRCKDQSISTASSSGIQTDLMHPASGIDGLLSGGQRPKIRQVSMLVYNSTNATNDALDERCMATHIEHGKLWGYPTHVLREDVRGKGQWRELVFSKPLYMLSIAVAEMAKTAKERVEWLVFFDSDTILLNPYIPWTLFLPPSDFPNIHFVASRDWAGFNAGVFFLRINEWSVKMLTEVAALPDLRPDVQIGYNAEQAAFKWVMSRAGYREHVIYQPNKWFNGFEESFGHLPLVQDGDMLVHFSGLKGAKFGAVQRWLDRLDRTPEKLQIPLDETKYGINVEAYWSCLRDARDMIRKAEQVGDDNVQTRELRTAQKGLQQIIYDEADKPALLIEAIEKIKSAFSVFEKLEKGVVDESSGRHH